MISPTDAAAFLPPTFQILTGLIFALLLVVRYFAAKGLKPLWGKVTAFSLIFIALGCFLMSLATAKTSMGGGAEMFTLAGVSIAIAAILVVTGLILAARSNDG